MNLVYDKGDILNRREGQTNKSILWENGVTTSEKILS